MKKLLVLCLLALCLTLWTASAPEMAELDLSAGPVAFTGTADGSAVALQNGVETIAAHFRIVQSGGKTANYLSVRSGSVSLTLSGLNVEASDAALSVASGATLTATLDGANTLWSLGSAGIHVPGGAELALDGSGSLIAVGRNHSAGIGGGFRENSGSITINGGTITANGIGAGIGGGTGGSGDVTITGGHVTANGSGLSAGLGGGYGATRVTITGGTVVAKGASGGADGGGAGIGNCNYGSGAVITITGGNVTATGGPGGGAGIGGGDHGAAGSVYISGATVTARGGGQSAGIGGGSRTSYDQTGGSITIENAVVSVTGYYSAIGGGSAQNSHGCSSILIRNSTVTAAYTAASGILYNEIVPYPSIVGPLQHSTAAGSPTRLQVAADVPSGFTCLWQCSPNGVDSWIDIPDSGAAVSGFSIVPEQSGRYFRCRVTNAYGSSAYAGPIRIYTLAYTQVPASVRQALNTTATLSAASSTPNITWHWERSTDLGQTYTRLPGESGSTLSVTLTTEQNDALYRCGITGTNGSVLYSDPVRVCTEDAPCYYRQILYLQELDGSYTTAKQEQIDAAAGTRVAISIPVPEGYAENRELGQTLGTVREDCSLVLTRYCDRRNTTLSFETGCSVRPSPVTDMYGAAVTLPTPTVDGAEFGGWFTDRERKEPADFTGMPAKDMTLYALWIVDEAARGMEYRIGGIILEPDEVGETATVPTGSFTARVFLTNLSSLCADHVVLTVHDADGRQQEMYWSSIRTDIGKTAEVAFRVENASGTAAAVKAFVLSSGPSMKPLTDRAVFGSSKS